VPTIQELMIQKAMLDEQIKAHKPAAIGQVQALMTELGVTLEDLGGAKQRQASASKRAVKYRDAAGNTWTGVGQRPRWLVAALQGGAQLEQFRVQA
jgi:DNA-binding protein H-NS